MKKYKVLLNGVNFLIKMNGEANKHGFYTTVFVEATDYDSAETAAVDMLRKDESIRQLVLNSHDDPPELHLEEVDEISDWPTESLFRSGLAWYPEDPPT